MPSREIPVHDCFRESSVIEYLGILWPERTRRDIAKLLASGAVRSRGRTVAGDEIVGDLGELTLARPLDAAPPPASNEKGGGRPLDVLHEDDRLVVLAKPPGVPVIPDRARRTESCLELLVRRELDARRTKPPEAWVRPRVVHRIDRLASGLVIVAKTPEAERRFSSDAEARRIRKEYIALLQGEVLAARVTVDCPVGPGRKGRMRAAGHDEFRARGVTARDAVTVFETVERLERTTLVRALPLTGRTHQIRVHGLAFGHPLAVDPLYRVGPRAAAGELVPGLARLTLHARRYELPVEWSEPREFTCPLAADLGAALGRLGSVTKL